MLSGRHVLDDQGPGGRRFVDERLEHRKDVAGPLRLIGHQAARRVQRARRHVPAGAALEAERPGQLEDLVVTLVPDLQAMPELLFGRARLQAEEGVGHVGQVVVELVGEVVGLRLGLAAHQRGRAPRSGADGAGARPYCRRTWRTSASRGAGPTPQRPARPRRRPAPGRQRGCAAAGCVAVHDVAQALVGRGLGAVVGLDGRRRASARRCRRGARQRRTGHAGCSFSRFPGIQKERGTQAGASRTIPSPLLQSLM